MDDYEAEDGIDVPSEEENYDDAGMSVFDSWAEYMLNSSDDGVDEDDEAARYLRDHDPEAYADYDDEHLTDSIAKLEAEQKRIKECLASAYARKAELLKK